MQCPQCQTENRAERKFCAACGQPLALTCPQCGFVNEPADRFCGGCGRALSPAVPTPAPLQERPPVAYTPKHLADKILTTRSALEGERKQVTVLFCDLANSTALATRLGPETMHRLLHQFFELGLGEVHRYEGTVNQFLGDGFMALLAPPLPMRTTPDGRCWPPWASGGACRKGLCRWGSSTAWRWRSASG
jgi:class 3 adenylate cyclase